MSYFGSLCTKVLSIRGPCFLVGDGTHGLVGQAPFPVLHEVHRSIRGPRFPMDHGDQRSIGGASLLHGEGARWDSGRPSETVRSL